MKKQRINEEITQEMENQALQGVEVLKGLLPFLVDLSPVDRKRMVKLSRRRQDFIDKVLIHAEQNPGFVPSFVNLDEFQKDARLIKALQRIRASVLPFHQKLRDSIMVTQESAYDHARAFYSTVKTAARHGADNTEPIIVDLAYHFKRNGSNVENEEMENGSRDNDVQGS